MLRLPSPRYLSYDDLRIEADRIVDEYWPDRRIPVDIEHIVDVELAIDIIPTQYLHAKWGIDGVLSSNLQHIWVDERLHDEYLHRYRFTLAHEVAHLFLHRQLYEAASYRSIEEWESFLTKIAEVDRRWYEWQAYCFAGLILVQEEPLVDRVEEARSLAKKNGLELDFNIEADCQYAAEYVGRRFEVSGQVIMKRGRYDGLWTFQ